MGCRGTTNCCLSGMKRHFSLSHLQKFWPTKQTHIPCPQIWDERVPLSRYLGWWHFSTYPISDNFDQQNKLTSVKGWGLPDNSFLYVPSGEAPGSLRLIKLTQTVSLAEEYLQGDIIPSLLKACLSDSQIFKHWSTNFWKLTFVIIFLLSLDIKWCQSDVYPIT